MLRIGSVDYNAVWIGLVEYNVVFVHGENILWIGLVDYNAVLYMFSSAFATEQYKQGVFVE